MDGSNTQGPGDPPVISSQEVPKKLAIAYSLSSAPTTIMHTPSMVDSIPQSIEAIVSDTLPGARSGITVAEAVAARVLDEVISLPLKDTTDRVLDSLDVQMARLEMLYSDNHRSTTTTHHNLEQALQETSDLARPYTTFTVFSKLPVELQVKIWKHAIPGPQNIVISIDSYPASANFQLKCFSNSAPAMLLACQMSRETILKTYTTCFTTKGNVRKIWVDGEKDIVIFLGLVSSLFTGENPNLKLLKKAVAGVENLAVTSNFVFPRELHVDALKNFTALQKVILFDWPYSRRGDDRYISGTIRAAIDPDLVVRTVWGKVLRKAFDDRVYTDAKGVENEENLPKLEKRPFTDFPEIEITQDKQWDIVQSVIRKSPAVPSPSQHRKGLRQ